MNEYIVSDKGYNFQYRSYIREISSINMRIVLCDMIIQLLMYVISIYLPIYYLSIYL